MVVLVEDERVDGDVDVITVQCLSRRKRMVCRGVSQAALSPGDDLLNLFSGLLLTLHQIYHCLPLSVITFVNLRSRQYNIVLSLQSSRMQGAVHCLLEVTHTGHRPQVNVHSPDDAQCHSRRESHL